MLTSRWFPLMTSELSRFQHEVDRMFASVAGAARRPGLAYTYPPVNLWEDEGHFYAEAELPGMPLDALEIFVNEGNQLTIQGERKPVETRGAWHRQERGFGKFSRTFTLPGEVDADKVEAKLEQGVLRVTLPKSERARPRRIAVKGE
jgi:HSP20 family protein